MSHLASGLPSDLDKAELRVRQCLVLLHHRPDFAEPKTQSSKRTIALDARTVATLREHRAKQFERRLQWGAVWQDHDLVFASEVGTPIEPHNLARRFRALVAKAGVRHMTIHGLRHTHATLLMLAGVHPKVVSERLGHANITLTLQTYSHVLPQMQKDAVSAFAALVSATP